MSLQLLDATMQVANERAQADAEDILHDIQRAITHNQNQPLDMLLLHQTESLCQRADLEIKRIRSLRRDLLRGRTRRNQGGDIPAQGAASTDANEQADKAVSSFIAYVKQMLVQRLAPAKGFDASYSQKMEQFMNPIDEKLARIYRLTGDQSHSSTVFSRPSLVETLALLAQKEAVIRNYELVALAHQNQKIGCGLGITFDKVGVFATAESNTVSAGETYKAEMFLTVSNTKAASQMSVNGKPIAIGPDGHGRVEFQVPSAAGKAQAAKAYWTGTIRTFVNGRDSTFKVLVPYTIRPNQAEPASGRPIRQ